MFLAFAESLRSADLSRQVGAVVVSSAGEVIATGANDVPRHGGGLYRPGVGDQRDYVWGEDSNKVQIEKIVQDILHRAQPKPKPASRSELENVLRGSRLHDLTEFGRAVHAEMEALLSCARSGVSPRGGVLYCTTFPCHNCAKHIVAAGIERVFYVEPYPKISPRSCTRTRSLLIKKPKDACASCRSRVSPRGATSISSRCR